jgi:hypothetical protein
MPASRRNAIKALVTFGNGLPFSVMHCSSHVSRNTTFIGGPSSRKVSTIAFSAWFFDHPPPCTAAILVAHIPCAPAGRISECRDKDFADNTAATGQIAHRSKAVRAAAPIATPRAVSIREKLPG